MTNLLLFVTIRSASKDFHFLCANKATRSDTWLKTLMRYRYGSSLGV